MQGSQIDVVDLGKSYGEVTALVDVNLKVRAGTILAVLGHNGAGKTTLIDILATRTLPTTGSATVCGWDVVRFGHHVRRHIGMTGQFAAVDDTMPGRGNLILLARLLGASRRQARTRADELLESFGLTDAAHRKTSTYSGGMRRRLDLAASLLGRPEVLFLDEPTTGLDPVSRTELWRAVAALAANGTAVILTTQYLEEADRLADDVAVLAAGNVVARGTPGELKAGIGPRTITVRFPDLPTTQLASAVLSAAHLNPRSDDQRCAITVPFTAAGDIPQVIRALDGMEIPVQDLTITEPTLDDVYISLHNAGWQPS
ncbi:MAG: ATP-binding cassette domain-containing protein [Haloechinothrix sp.]